MRDGAAGIDYSHSGRAGYSARRADCRGAELFDGEVLPLWKWGTDQIIFGVPRDTEVSSTSVNWLTRTGEEKPEYR